MDGLLSAQKTGQRRRGSGGAGGSGGEAMQAPLPVQSVSDQLASINPGRCNPFGSLFAMSCVGSLALAGQHARLRPQARR